MCDAGCVCRVMLVLLCSELHPLPLTGQSSVQRCLSFARGIPMRKEKAKAPGKEADRGVEPLNGRLASGYLQTGRGRPEKRWLAGWSGSQVTRLGRPPAGIMHGAGNNVRHGEQLYDLMIGRCAYGESGKESRSIEAQ